MAKKNSKLTAGGSAVIPIGHIEQRILLIRGQRIILAADLARMYGVPVKRLNEQVKRNASRFPDDFVFQLTREEADTLSRSQIATLKNPSRLRSQIATSNSGRGGQRYRPYAFTEHGALMAANLLKSPLAANRSWKSPKRRQSPPSAITPKANAENDLPRSVRDARINRRGSTVRRGHPPEPGLVRAVPVADPTQVSTDVVRRPAHSPVGVLPMRYTATSISPTRKTRRPLSLDSNSRRRAA
ncbi:MAG: hypothetical protein JWN24_2174 [Phycisphaerales bacterium]|nr:hypothetical protein [Phycisphaerales bacterium]